MLVFVPFTGFAALVTVPVPVPTLLTVSRLVVKLAVAVRSALIITLQLVPLATLQPLQAPKIEPASGTAVRLSVVPTAFADLQIEPQLIGTLVAPPPGALPVTVPLPAPVFTTVKAEDVNRAVMVRAALMVTWHTLPPGPLIIAHPLHEVNDEPWNAVAVTFTGVVSAKACTQSRPHEMPAGELTAIPEPVPVTATVSLAPVKVAVTARVVELSVTTHGPVVLVQPPLHPEKVTPGSGVAASVTMLPSGNTCEHAPGSVGHEIPDGTLVTVPLPPPASVTVSVDIAPVPSSRANACGAETPPPSQATIGVKDGSGPTASAGASPCTSGPLTPVPD